MTLQPGGSDSPAIDPVVAALFDSSFYLLQNPDVAASGVNPLEHFWRWGRFEGRNPTPLFDGLHYRAQRRGAIAAADPLSDYIHYGASLGLSPHPLFDPVHYARQAGDAARTLTPLGHYLNIGWRKGLSPHPLFDPEYYLFSLGMQGVGASPLVHYISQEASNFTPHYLFSDAVYVAEIAKSAGAGGTNDLRGETPLVHYVKTGHRQRVKTHPLFEPAHYRKSFERWAKANNRLSLARELEFAPDLLRHYVDVGSRVGVSPSPYFDSDHVREQMGASLGSADPLRHYLTPAGFSRISPHPAIDLHHYAEQAGILLDDVPSLLHLLSVNEAERVSPHPALRLARNVHRTKRAVGPVRSPILDFLENGMLDGVTPNRFFSADYVRATGETGGRFTDSAVHRYFAGTMTRKPRIVFVSHDASLTGAPGTVLRLIEEFNALFDVESFAILGSSGARVADFKRSAHTLVLDTLFTSAPPERLDEAVDELLAITRGNEPLFAIVNSMESRMMGLALSRAGIPVVTLVHEDAKLYPPGAFDIVARASSKIIFGSQFVLDRARRVQSLREPDVSARGQGLQQDQIGNLPRPLARREVLRELQLDDDVFLVLGCGTVDLRKGADLFVEAALEFLQNCPTGTRACFVWVGERPATGVLTSHITSLIEARGRGADIRFIGGRSDVEPYFVAADAFLMTSRIDPFPCVCQEAMAAGLPIIAFTEGGGAVEIIGDDAGFCVPLPDTSAMAEKLLLIANDRSIGSTLGRRGRELVRAKWRFDDYARDVAAAACDAAGIAVAVLGEGRSSTARPGERRVYLMFDDWTPSALAAEAEVLVSELGNRGFTAEILLTRGRYAASSGSGILPEGPFSCLQPGDIERNEGRWETSLGEIADGIVRFARQMQPCVLVAMQDQLAAGLGERLPPGVGLVALLQGEDAGSLEHAYAVGPLADRIVARTEAASDALQQLNPALSSRVVLIGPAAGAASEIEPRDEIFVEADLNDAAVASMLLRLRLGLRELGCDPPFRVCSTGATSATSDLWQLDAAGLAESEVMTNATASQRQSALQGARLAIFAGSETESTSVTAAMAAGCIPIVVKTTADSSQLLVHEDNGLVFRGDEIGSLSARIAELTRSPEASAKLRDGIAAWLAAKTIQPGAAAGRYADLLEGLFAELAQGSAQRALAPAAQRATGQGSPWRVSASMLAEQRIVQPQI